MWCHWRTLVLCLAPLNSTRIHHNLLTQSLKVHFDESSASHNDLRPLLTPSSSWQSLLSPSWIGHPKGILVYGNDRPITAVFVCFFFVVVVIFLFCFVLFVFLTEHRLDMTAFFHWKKEKQKKKNLWQRYAMDKYIIIFLYFEPS